MKTKMQTRDYISSGILSLIFMAVTFIVGAVTQAIPATFLLMPMFVAIFTGPLFMLYAAKIPKRGAITILGFICGIISFVGGMFWMMAAFFVAFGIAADLICSIGKYQSFKWSMLAFSLFAISPSGGHVAMFFLQSQFGEFMTAKGDVSMYEEGMNFVAQNWWAAVLIIVGSMICGVIGGLIGKVMMKKHFERAGIV